VDLLTDLWNINDLKIPIILIDEENTTKESVEKIYGVKEYHKNIVKGLNYDQKLEIDIESSCLILKRGLDKLNI
jgi:RNase H-fold protein (predicted Holliday junction resolvase)